MTLKSCDTEISLEPSSLSTLMGQYNNSSMLSLGGCLTYSCKHTHTVLHTFSVPPRFCITTWLPRPLLISSSACSCCHMQNSVTWSHLPPATFCCSQGIIFLSNPCTRPLPRLLPLNCAANSLSMAGMN